jgi:hypothetical protein
MLFAKWSRPYVQASRSRRSPMMNGQQSRSYGQGPMSSMGGAKTRGEPCATGDGDTWDADF